jgi:hypothetical protein
MGEAWTVAVPWDPDSPAQASSRRLAERAARDEQEQRREQRMAGLKNAALLRRHLMLQERAILLEMGRDPATLPPVPSLEAIELVRPEALGIPWRRSPRWCSTSRTPRMAPSVVRGTGRKSACLTRNRHHRQRRRRGRGWRCAPGFVRPCPVPRLSGSRRSSWSSSRGRRSGDGRT